jgi:hypothetical protein
MNAVAPLARDSAHDIMERVIIQGDLSKLTPQERVDYYNAVCRSVGLNPLTQPFAYIWLNGKLVLYAQKNCTDQLRTIHEVSVEDMAESEREGVYIVTAKVRNKDGRTDMAKGAVPIASLRGEALANAMMKAETKAKRRATLSICGLGWLDESEADSIPGAVPVDPDTGEVKTPPQVIEPPKAPKPPPSFVVHLINGKVRTRKNAAEWRKDILGGIEHFANGEDLARFEAANIESMAELETVAPVEVAEVRRVFDARLRGNDRDLNDSVEDIGRG